MDSFISCPFYPQGNGHDCHCVRGWVCPTPVLDALKTEISYLWWESNHDFMAVQPMA